VRGISDIYKAGITHLALQVRRETPLQREGGPIHAPKRRLLNRAVSHAAQSGNIWFSATHDKEVRPGRDFSSH
jgi:hypothetical protein